jgi:hypothetical protein
MWNVWPDRKVDSKTIADAFAMAKDACVAIAPIFTHDNSDCIVLEFENVYVNYLLLGKKLYATLQYSADLGPEKPKQTVKKGLRCVRRDTVGLARDSQSLCVEHITNNRVSEALEVGRDTVRALFKGEVPFEQLVTSKKVSSVYVVNATTSAGSKVKVSVTPHGKWTTKELPERSGTCVVVAGSAWLMVDSDGAAFGQLTLAQPHVHVMHRMETRTPNGGPRVGDRVRYVFVEKRDAHSALQIARAEDPVWAASQNMRPDCAYYYEHAVRPPLDAVLGLFVPRGCDAELGWGLQLLTARNQSEGQRSLSAFGFGVANPLRVNAKVSKVSRRPTKKPKTQDNTSVSRNGIGAYFGK